MFALASLRSDPHSRTLVRIHDVVPLILRRALSCKTPLIIRPKCFWFIYMWNCIELQQYNKKIQLCLHYHRNQNVYFGTPHFYLQHFYNLPGRPERRREGVRVFWDTTMLWCNCLIWNRLGEKYIRDIYVYIYISWISWIYVNSLNLTKCLFWRVQKMMGTN